MNFQTIKHKNMENSIVLNEQDFDKITLEIEEIINEDECFLFQVIGHITHNTGMTISKSKSSQAILFDYIEEPTESFNVRKTVNFFANLKPISNDEAESNGRDFWEELNTKIKYVICNNDIIKKLMTEEGKLKDYIKASIPLILAALGLSPILTPFVIALVAVILAIIIKIGYDIYCEIPTI